MLQEQRQAKRQAKPGSLGGGQAAACVPGRVCDPGDRSLLVHDAGRHCRGGARDFGPLGGGGRDAAGRRGGRPAQGGQRAVGYLGAGK